MRPYRITQRTNLRNYSVVADRQVERTIVTGKGWPWFCSQMIYSVDEQNIEQDIAFSGVIFW